MNFNKAGLEMHLELTVCVAYVGPELSKNIRPSSSAFCIACYDDDQHLQHLLLEAIYLTLITSFYRHTELTLSRPLT